jgi:hypothetical protein
MGNVGLQYFHWRYTALRPGDPQTGLDPAMRAAIAAIWDTSPAYRYLLQAVAGRYQLFFQDLTEEEAYGVASRPYHLIMVDLAYLNSPRNAATILVHEMQHARDFDAYGATRSANECFAREVRGFLTEAALWQHWYGQGGKPGATDPHEQEENAILQQIRTNPEGFARAIVQLYTENGQCRAYPAGGNADRLLTLDGLPGGIAAQLPVARVFAGLKSAFAEGGAGADLPGLPDFTITTR